MQPSLASESLLKRYGRFTALANLTVNVDPGVVGLLGPNGAGKSTLISVLLGQTPITSGRASVLGLDVRRQQRAIRKRVGFMPENDCLIGGLTGVGYVHYAGRLAGMSHGDSMQRTHEVLDYVDLGEARYRPAEQYSTGMKQRLKLAQAIVHDPDLLFLDEPTNGMDPQGRQAMLGLIADLGTAGISILLSSHLLPDVERVCQRVVIMSRGEVLTMGDIEEMRRPHPTLYALEYDGDAETFAGELSNRDVAVLDRPRSGVMSIDLPSPGRQQAVLEAAHCADITVRSMLPKRSSLEETFMAAIQRQEGR